MRLEFDTSSPEETQRLARALGERLDGGDLIALCGDLGSGKTTFTKGLLLGLGLEDVAVVSSPTYVLEHIYLASSQVHHYDVYRLGSAQEFSELGFEENLKQDRIVVIEWADNVSEVLPDERLTVELGIPEDVPAATISPDDEEFRVHSQRRVVLTGRGQRWERLAGLEFDGRGG